MEAPIHCAAPSSGTWSPGPWWSPSSASAWSSRPPRPPRPPRRLPPDVGVMMNRHDLGFGNSNASPAYTPEDR